MKKQLSLLLLAMVLVGSAQAQRDPLKWPFSKTSIWNMPIHKDAVLVPANIQPKTGWGLGITEDEDVIILTPYEPLITIYKEGWGSDQRCKNLGPYPDKLPVPASLIVKKGGTPNHAAAILMPDGETIYQCQPFDKCSQGSVAYTMYKYPSVSIYGEGSEGAHGGSGLSSIGGTVRLGEVVPGGEIKHAIKVNLYGKEDLYYNKNEPDGKPGYRWPALRADGYASPTTYAGTNPALQMGSLLALPPDFDIKSLKTEPAKIFARAFMNYGGYVDDESAWDVWGIPTEKGPNGSVMEEFARVWGYGFNNSSTTHPYSLDMQKILFALHVVDNNDAKNIGGGPTDDWENRRAPMAPDFAEITGSVTGVTVSPASTLLAIGVTKQLTATVFPIIASNKTVSWSSSNTLVATVDTNGVVTGIADGSVVISVTTQDGNKTANCAVNVSVYGGHIPIPAKIEAEDYIEMNGVQTENTLDADGGINVGWIEQGDWLDYEIHVPEEGNYTIDLRLASPNSDRQLQLIAGGIIVATVDVPNTGGWQNWKTVSDTVHLNAGNQTLRILSSNGTSYNWNINRFELKAPTVNAQVNFLSEFKVFPNPIRLGEPFNIKVDNAKTFYSLKITDLTGKVVYFQKKYDTSEIYIYQKGIYFVSIFSDSFGSREVAKIVVI